MAGTRAQIGFLWLVGVLAAAQLAKIAVLAPSLRQEFDLTLAQAGLLISLLEVGGAVFGFAAGMLIGRVGARRLLFIGLVVLMFAGGVQALAVTSAVLFTARAVEGMGYALVVVAAPTMIAAIANERQRGPALALWGTFVPLGVAIGSISTGVLAVAVGSTGVLLFWTAAFGLALTLATRLPSPRHGTVRGIRMPHGPAWLVTASFGLYTTLVCALTALLPLYLVERQGISLAEASGWAGSVSATALPGCLLIMLLMHRGRMRETSVIVIAAGPLLASAVPALAIFGSDAGGSGASKTIGLAAMTVLLGGLTPPFILARLPRHSGARSGDDPKLAVAQGLLTQFGAGGALLGPPLAGIVVGYRGWAAFGAMLAGLTLATLLVMIAAEWLSARRQTRLVVSNWSAPPQPVPTERSTHR